MCVGVWSVTSVHTIVCSDSHVHVPVLVSVSCEYNMMCYLWLIPIWSGARLLLENCKH